MAEYKFTEKSEQVVTAALELAAQNCCPQGKAGTSFAISFITSY